MKDVELFTNFVDKEGLRVVNLKETHIKKFNLHLNELGYSNHTIARKNSSLRIYFKYMRKEGFMVGNPMEDIKQPNLPKRENGLTAEDFRLMEEKAENGATRDLILLSLAYYDKVKISEIIKLKREAFEKQQGILYLEKKAVILNNKTKNLLENAKGDEEGYLVVNQHNKPLSESGAYFILKNYFDGIGKPELRPVDLYRKNELL